MSEPGTGPGPEDGPGHKSETDRYETDGQLILGFVRASQLEQYQQADRHISDHDQATVPDGVTLLEDLRAGRTQLRADGGRQLSDLDEDDREQIREDPVLELSDFDDPEGSK